MAKTATGLAFQIQPRATGLCMGWQEVEAIFQAVKHLLSIYSHISLILRIIFHALTTQLSECFLQ